MTSNTYVIDPTSDFPYQVTASDSDLAIASANREAKRRSLLSRRATLSLVSDEDTKVLGEFDLNGHRLPQSWREFQALIQETRQRALSDAKTTSGYPCHRSRGVMLTAEGSNGETLIACGEDYEMPKTLAGFRKAVEQLQNEFPGLHTVWAECGYDSAASVYDLNEVLDYAPWTGEAEVMVWHREHQSLTD